MSSRAEMMRAAVSAAAWYEADEAEVHSAVMAIVDRITTSQGYRREKDLRHMRLYGDMPVMGFGAWSYSRAQPSAGGLGQLSLNVVKNCCNSVTARVCKTRVRPMFLTSEGDWGQQQKAKGLQRFTEGQFYESAVYSTTPRCCLDAPVFGTGVAQVYREAKKIKVDRVIPGELRVDEAEGIYGEPRSIYRVKVFDRAVATVLWPKAKEFIEHAARSRDEDAAAAAFESTADVITIVEAWHLPSGPDEGDGRHVIVTDQGALLDEEWERDHFPFAFLRWDEPLLGFWGVGLAEQLTGIQLEINKLLRHIQQSMHIAGNLKVFLQRGSKVVRSTVTNEIGCEIQYDGNPPVFAPNPVVAPEMYQHLWALEGKAYSITGVSQLSAQSQKPAGLNSGKALDTFADIESERFVKFGQAWEEFHIEIARQMVELAREIAEEDPSYAVRYVGKGMIDVVRLKDVDLDENAYWLQAFPTNALSRDPAERMNQVQNLANAQWISPEDAKRLLDFPDLDEYGANQNAPFDLVKKVLLLMVDKGEYMGPEPEWNLDLCLRESTYTYARCRLDGVPDDRCELVRNFMEDCRQLKKQAAPPPAPPMPPGLPPGPPGMPPMGGPPMPPGMPPGLPPGAPPPMQGMH